MLKKWQLVLLIATILLFLSFNIFLVKKDHSKVEKVEYIESWTTVKQGDIKKVLNKPGVTVTSEETHIYFDENMGAFSSFFVKEGDEVTRGTALFEYSPNDIENEISQLEAELAETEDKISSVNSHISDLTDYKAELDMELAKEDEPNFITSMHDLDREIYDKELEMDLLENEASKLEDKIDSLEDNMDNLTVESDVDGVIKEINTELDNPLMTISAPTIAIAGMIREGEMKDVSEGLKAIVTSHNLETELYGTVSNISKIPEDEPKVEKETLYPFKVDLETDSGEILAGTHVAVEIVTEEAAGALLVPEGSIYERKEKEYINILTQSGTIEKREIQTGIKVNGKGEIKSGAEVGEMVLIHKKPQLLVNGSKFITPIKFNKLHKPDPAAIKKDWKVILEGFLSR